VLDDVKWVLARACQWKAEQASKHLDSSPRTQKITLPVEDENAHLCGKWLGQRMACVALGLHVRSYGQGPFDRVVGGGGFHVLKDENAHGARKAAHSIVPRPWWFEPHGAIDVGQQAAVAPAKGERDLPEPIPDWQNHRL
jgi:hypothetical protein